MAEADDVKVQNVDMNKTVPVTREQKARTARRQFLRQALAVTSGVAISELLPSSLLEAATQNTPVCPPAGPAFIPVGEITSQGGKLQAIMKVVSGNRDVPTRTGAIPTKTMLRYFDGYNPANPGQKWPVTQSVAGPGPTLRCGIGDVVQITLLNQVKVQDFGGSLDSGEEGRGNGCDQATKVNADGTTDKNWYPANDKYPNCLHGSSSANIHFHGTHVTPSTTGDNILVNVRPNAKVTEKDVQQLFQQIFQHCELGQQPKKWEDLPQGWRDDQKKLLKEYDETAPYVGPGRNPDGHGLPPTLQLWPQDQQAIDQGVWPQWYSGSYPYCFQIPKYDGAPGGLKMGQSPGTHWYHSHKHGSTAINLYNGLAGALIITDTSPTGYDGKLQAFYNGKLEERVLVIQQITAAPNLLSAAPPGPPALLVNGQITPTITMQPNQVQLWRMINATVQGFVNAQFTPLTQKAKAIQFKQTAQDGVQLAWENFSNAQNGTQPINMAPANRVDVLVLAPAAPGCYVLQDTKLGPIVYINVTGSAINPPMVFPTKQDDFPTQPTFLADIDPSTIRLHREITYGWDRGTKAPGRVGANPPQYNIDGKKFEDQVIDQVMLLDTAEEWTIYNATMAIAHPFHIHVNPFQIVEVYDPATMTAPLKLSPPYVWWDTFAIPAGVADSTGKNVTPGYFKMRSRFVDFTGLYVQHCHILAHEDRGMMQLLQVVNNRTVLKHH
jgi:FtsP/CotA-like multicopper oxidase with cupredoxin domain